MEPAVPRSSPTVALCGATLVVELDPPTVMVADVVIAGDRVAALAPAPPGVARRDCTGALIVPGNVCAHHHLYSALSRGMPYHLAPPTTFTEILQRVWWRLDRALDDGSIRASALAAGLDALLAGTTTIVDHHASPNAIDGSLDVIADALGELGLRAVLSYEVSDRDGPERARAGIAENVRFLRERRPLARGMMGAHASFTLSDATLDALVDGARAAGAGVHIHVAEDDVDQRDAEARHHRRVIERLRTAGALTEDALLAHCIHVDPSEVKAIADAGATVVCNPRSNMNNAVGHSPFNSTGGRVALGTDGIGGDMFTESQAGYFRTREADIETPGGWPLARLAEGARLAGRIFGEPLLGTLRPGAPADLVVLDYPSPTAVTADNLAAHWTFGLSAAAVREVFVAGRLVVEGRRSTRVDQVEVERSSRREADRLWTHLEALPAHDFQPQGGPH
ncbi:MAG TPA: amidohydrolase family protein [Acidimicrobiales bacterium]|nr:amidohydrolase family protein [Acidimicrobiales bacterium]